MQPERTVEIPRLTIEFAGDTPIYESETGRWCLYEHVVPLLRELEEMKAKLNRWEKGYGLQSGEAERYFRRTDQLQQQLDAARGALKALAALVVEAFEIDFPEGRGIDGESSSLAWVVDMAEVLSDGGDATPLLPDPGVSDAADRFRATFHTQDGTEDQKDGDG